MKVLGIFYVDPILRTNGKNKGLGKWGYAFTKMTKTAQRVILIRGIMTNFFATEKWQADIIRC